MEIKAGDLYRSVLKDGRYGAVKVLKTGGKFDFSPYDFHLIGVTTFIDEVPPTVDNEKLKTLLVRENIYPNGYPVIGIYCGKFPKELLKVGNIGTTRTEDELNIEIGDGTNGGFPSHGNIPKTIGYEVLIEWRHKYDSKAFKREIEASRARQDQEIRKHGKNDPKTMLGETQFWKIIEEINYTSSDKDDSSIEPAIEALSRCTVNDIEKFEESLAFKLYLLDTKEHAKNIGEFSFDEDEEYVSADFFLYARCAAVARGKEFYEEVVQSPAKMPKNTDFEPLLFLASEAYNRKSGDDFEYETGCSYETYSNQEGWD